MTFYWIIDFSETNHLLKQKHHLNKENISPYYNVLSECKHTTTEESGCLTCFSYQGTVPPCVAVKRYDP